MLACLDGEVLVEGSCVRPILGLDDGLNEGEVDGEIVTTDGELLGFDVGSLESEGRNVAWLDGEVLVEGR